MAGLPRPGYDRDGYHPRPLVKDTQPSSGVDWSTLVQEELETSKENFARQSGVAKNIVLFIGDGLGVSTVTAARLLMAEKKGIALGEKTSLSFENFPSVGLSKTYEADRWVADSAGAATAILCGEKVNFYTLGLRDTVSLSDCSNVSDETKLKSVLKHAIDAGIYLSIY